MTSSTGAYSTGSKPHTFSTQLTNRILDIVDPQADVVQRR
eukprot:CAMPEP_0185754250 /NCGR_PEP_ID=MMETSP1174-20130828/12895_1 /TAXON_ID=35687 /ORGANISM="Dictyocha speculum, Strain CCMP1381" /LENGTH=39 /DNA_ID= /DNA_START= /DNA_END= /DNA_ORIENTATION=